MIVNLCILWRFLVTWIHAKILTTSLVREFFQHQGPYVIHLIFTAISENILWICTLPLVVSSCTLLSVVSLLGYSVAQVDVGTMVVEVGLVDSQLLSALMSVPVCFFYLML